MCRRGGDCAGLGVADEQQDVGRDLGIKRAQHRALDPNLDGWIETALRRGLAQGLGGQKRLGRVLKIGDDDRQRNFLWDSL